MKEEKKEKPAQNETMYTWPWSPPPSEAAELKRGLRTAPNAFSEMRVIASYNNVSRFGIDNYRVKGGYTSIPARSERAWPLASSYSGRRWTPPSGSSGLSFPSSFCDHSGNLSQTTRCTAQSLRGDIRISSDRDLTILLAPLPIDPTCLQRNRPRNRLPVSVESAARPKSKMEELRDWIRLPILVDGSRPMVRTAIQ